MAYVEIEDSEQNIYDLARFKMCQKDGTKQGLSKFHSNVNLVQKSAGLDKLKTKSARLFIRSWRAVFC